MAASFFNNAMKVDFESVLTMEHTIMDKMIKSLEDTGLKGFLEASGSIYEANVVEFFSNEKFIARTIVIFVSNQKLALTKEVFAETFGLPTEWLVGFLDIPSKTVAEMRMKFSGNDAPFRSPNKKKYMKMEYRLLHDIVAKALCAKAGYFTMITRDKFDLMVVIIAGLKLVKLHPQKVLNNKSVRKYIKKNLNAVPAGEYSKKTEDTSKRTAVEKKKKRIEKVVQVSPARSKSGTSSDADSCLLSRLKKGVVTLEPTRITNWGWATAGGVIDAPGIGERVGPPVVIRCLMHSICILFMLFICSPYWGLTPCPSGAWFVCCLLCCPGHTTGRGGNPAGGAPGGG
ncbi:hypothetical protein F511_24525 [Dorcoceras hygrometricum]|uniref:Uncharacterized protein n=1 Tax=Dorcoceras hygrometricum TaxID=472368 RepID=A0A2Z7B4H3_9LAMI|nr:hypothetical protein F511_24525 [Dorcoceras hygrometricum]